ncbi:4'-phosphopantetheinyl transferase family protein [Porphyromonas pogonae]|uniref:4'-phosphopantetheinyl transferase family protein n=1 Tax=Porphyromonas pogonae TaxID=867595 RepID=UPI002E79551B|nr:4'-phosphopantetheinyl transferase superfamily protein [Porphyromonas pogonae]
MYSFSLPLSPSLSAILLADDFFPDMCDLAEGEKLIVQSSWSASRLKTFILGRIAARLALSRLKIENKSILKGQYGEPVWPAHIVGSISHKENIAIAVVANKDDYLGVGVDIEDASIELSQKECLLFCTDNEIQNIRNQSQIPINIFSRKEAFFKAFFSAYHKLCDWKELDVLSPRVSHIHKIDFQLFLHNQFLINLCLIQCKD